MSNMTPREIVHDLDKYIIGQSEAKRAVAIALRNRWRRMRLDEALRNEISPKNTQENFGLCEKSVQHASKPGFMWIYFDFIKAILTSAIII